MRRKEKVREEKEHDPPRRERDIRMHHLFGGIYSIPVSIATGLNPHPLVTGLVHKFIIYFPWPKRALEEGRMARLQIERGDLHVLHFHQFAYL
jgi:hypothetical protein